MRNLKKLGIWLDHSTAHLIEYKTEAEVIVITSKFDHQSKSHSLSKGENGMHTKEQHQQLEYYKKLGDSVQNYDEVLLFGPTEAKVELLHVLRKDTRFNALKLEIRQADKMTMNQQQAFVRDYFSNQEHSKN